MFSEDITHISPAAKADRSGREMNLIFGHERTNRDYQLEFRLLEFRLDAVHRKCYT